MIESKDGKLASCNLLITKEIKELGMSGIKLTLHVALCKESLISIKREREREVVIGETQILDVVKLAC